MGLRRFLQKLALLGVDRVDESQAGISNIDELATRLGMQHQAGQLAIACANKDFETAKELLDQILERCERAFGHDHLQTAVVLEELGVVGSPDTEFEEIEQSWKECLRIRESKLSLDHDDTMRIRHLLGCLYQYTGRHVASLEMLEQNQNFLRSEPEKDFSRTNQMLSSMAVSYRQTNESAKAEACWRELVERTTKRLGIEDADTIVAQCQLANYLASMQRYEEALAELQDCAERLECTTGSESPKLVQVYHLMSAVLAADGQFAEAEAMYAQCVQICLANSILLIPRRPFKRSEL